MPADVRIVLVSPSGPANIGSACRAMANFGLSDLHIVAPRCDVRHEQAVAYAAHGLWVLDRAVVVQELGESLSGCVRTYATSSKLGLYRRQAAVAPRMAAMEALRLIGGSKRNSSTETDSASAESDAPDTVEQGPRARVGPSAPAISESSSHGPFGVSPRVAVAFGREDFGFRTRELLQFDRVITIPAQAEYPVLNLAAAVAIVCYELHLAEQALAGLPMLPMALSGPVATSEKKEVLFSKLFDSLERIGFLFGPNPDHLKYALRHLLGRVEMSENEADILIGLARQIRWYVENHPRKQP